MGHVYLAEHTRLGRKVALKRLKDRVATEPEAVAQFMTEAQAVNRIGHPHIVDITDFCNDEAGVYYLMELLEGRTLAELLRRDGPLSERQVLFIGHQMADALEAAHRADVLHLDIKPSNIFLVTKDGQADYAKLLDFGIARLRDAAGPDTAGPQQSMDMGPVTPAFMAPEQATTRLVDHRADIYSLGAVLYAMLAGRPPFDAESVAEFVHKHLNVEPTPLTDLEGLAAPVTAPCSRLVMRCLRKRPAERPQSARDLRDRLAAVAEVSCGILLVPGHPPETAPTRWSWRRVGLVAALVLVLVGAVAGYVFGWIGHGTGRWRGSGGSVEGATPARPTTPPVETVTLHVVSTPPGAEVYREDGLPRLLGLTPLRVEDLPREGSLIVRLKLAGYSERVLRVDLSQGSHAVRARLVRLPPPKGMARPTPGPMVARTRRDHGGIRARPRPMQAPPVMNRQPPMAGATGKDTGSTVDPFAR